MTEAFARLISIHNHYTQSKLFIVGAKEDIKNFHDTRRLHFPYEKDILYKTHDELIEWYSEAVVAKKLQDKFLNN